MSMGSRLKAAMLVLLLGWGAQAPGVHAQTWPSKPVRIIVPLAPGGSADVGARLVADKMTPGLGHPVLVESRPGGGGTVGVNFVAKSPPDGYTIVVGPAGAMAINVHLSKLPYDPQKDLAPLSGMMRSTLFIVSSPSGPLKTLQDIIAFGKANPGVLNWGTPGIGTAQHLAGELLNIMAGIKMVHVPFKGSTEGATAVMGGQIQLAIVGPAGIAPQVRGGKLHVVAGTDTQRSAGLPEVPTVAESGLPGYAASGWLGLFAPAGTPTDVVARLNAEIVRALRLPDVANHIISGGEQPHPTTPAELGEFLRSETEKWGRVIKTTGIRLER